MRPPTNASQARDFLPRLTLQNETSSRTRLAEGWSQAPGSSRTSLESQADVALQQSLFQGAAFAEFRSNGEQEWVRD